MTEHGDPAATTAALVWDGDGQPRSQLFDDVYFSNDNGLEESRYVFLHQNTLRERWHALPTNSIFVIAETGFGTGLNFLATWQLWQSCAQHHAQLHYISVEKHPLSCSDLTNALALWPELQDKARQLSAQYPPLDCPGFHRMQFGNVYLTLIFSDAENGLQELLPIVHGGANIQQNRAQWSAYFSRDKLVDAWYFDGFAPAKNPEMWSANLFHTAAKLSGAHTTFSTFTAAGAVKRALTNAGFTVEKITGFGRKRNMLRGNFNHSKTIAAHRKPQSSWHLTSQYATNPCRTAIIIGAGLAGATTAFSLAEKGIRVLVLEKKAIASGASGNPQGIVYGKLSHQAGNLANFNLNSWLYALRFYQATKLFQQCGDDCGTLQLIPQGQQANAQIIANAYARSKEFVQWLDGPTASKIAGIRVDQPCLWFPQAGWVSPPEVCRKLLQHPLIEVYESTPAEHIRYQNQQWCVSSQTKQFSAETLIVCCAQQAAQFVQCKLLPIKAIRGQMSLVSATAESQRLRCVICAQGYIAPPESGRHCIGASYNLHSTSTDLSDEEHRQNLQNVKTISTDFKELMQPDNQQGRVSFRCSTPDYLPLVGPVGRHNENLERFAAYRMNFKKPVDAPGDYFDNLFINTGHGSKGLTYTPLCAEILASLLTGSPLPLSRSQFLHLHPLRFLIRDLARNKV